MLFIGIYCMPCEMRRLLSLCGDSALVSPAILMAGFACPVRCAAISSGSSRAQCDNLACHSREGGNPFYYPELSKGTAICIYVSSLCSPPQLRNSPPILRASKSTHLLHWKAVFPFAMDHLTSLFHIPNRITSSSPLGRISLCPLVHSCSEC